MTTPTAAPEAPTESVEPTTDDTAPEKPETDAAESVPGEESLGDPGKKALDAMKADRKAAIDRAKTAEDELGRLKAAADGKEADYEANRKATEEADAKFQARLFASELKAAGAAEGVKHPEMLQRLIDSTDFPLDDEGNLDAGAITEAVKAAITQYDLAVQGGKRFQGTPDAGPRNADAPAQITREQVAKMSAKEIDAAHKAGLLNDALGFNAPH